MLSKENNKTRLLWNGAWDPRGTFPAATAQTKQSGESNVSLFKGAEWSTLNNSSRRALIFFLLLHIIHSRTQSILWVTVQCRVKTSRSTPFWLTELPARSQVCKKVMGKSLMLVNSNVIPQFYQLPAGPTVSAYLSAGAPFLKYRSII